MMVAQLILVVASAVLTDAFIFRATQDVKVLNASSLRGSTALRRSNSSAHVDVAAAVRNAMRMALNSTNHSGSVLASGTGPCPPEKTVFDFGFYDGADSWKYLSEGYCVVAVEADPDLVMKGYTKFSAQINSGHLILMNFAVMPAGATEGLTFYRSKCTPEWNSFLPTIACRTCNQPFRPDPAYCYSVPVPPASCKELLGAMGRAKFLKLDIEGAESGCFEGLKQLGPQFYPDYVSAELTTPEYIDSLSTLGFKSFKLVLQNNLWSKGQPSGPWGEGATDCRAGATWRSSQEVRSEMVSVMAKPYLATDPCPGGTCSIHDQNACHASVWYDVHARLT
jgi:FkbM family methyltransferase